MIFAREQEVRLPACERFTWRVVGLRFTSQITRALVLRRGVAVRLAALAGSRGRDARTQSPTWSPTSLSRTHMFARLTQADPGRGRQHPQARSQHAKAGESRSAAPCLLCRAHV